MKINKTKILASLLIVCLLVFSVIGGIWIKNQIYSEGVKAGSIDTVLYIAQLGFQCKEIPINIGNQTINLIAVECLKK